MQNKSGWNALLLSCRQGDVGYVRELIEHQADVNVVTGGEEVFSKGYTPLRFAEEGGHTKIVEMLKAAGATR